MKLLSTLILAAGFLAAYPAAAERLTFEQVRQANAARLSADELRTLVPGGTYKLTAGRLQTTWSHTPDGKLSGRRIVGGRNDARNGTWRISDDGAYCVDAVGNSPDDVVKWCRHVYRLNGALYSFEPDAAPETARYGFQFTR